ncbi:unnamed protein product, partial [Oppiella nova]
MTIGMKRESIVYGEEVNGRSHRRKRMKSDEQIVSTTRDLSPVLRHNHKMQDIVDQIPSVIRGLIFDLNELELSRFKQLFRSTQMIKDPNVKITSSANTYVDVFKVLQNRNERKCHRIVQMSTNMTEF